MNSGTVTFFECYMTLNAQFSLQWERDFVPLSDVQDRSIPYCGELASSIKTAVALQFGRHRSSLDIEFSPLNKVENDEMRLVLQMVVRNGNALLGGLRK